MLSAEGNAKSFDKIALRTDEVVANLDKQIGATGKEGIVKNTRYKKQELEELMKKASNEVKLFRPSKKDYNRFREEVYARSRK
ncbi:hypothetical protein CCR75_004401 [Bremia lactucae]|uniref:Uncharacterized protein n=1 Tax=Bremia lactucae TaxID=4779 RepID=A0A976IH70_BRELC|nr:hypothetical protein CCR75_004402 [Bremia lactucae]TDH71551.1 hypothetical protein CCR75_004401 [Bremia lactucae]